MRMSSRPLRAFFVIAGLLAASKLSAQTFQIYFGELHSHSSLSKDARAGSKPPAGAFAYAKHVALLDFLAISDHSDSLRGTYDQIIAAAAPYDNPDSQFVAISGQELGSLGSSGYGHINIFESPILAGSGGINDPERLNLITAYNFNMAQGATAQFNHPTTDNSNRNFDDFTYYPVYDRYVNTFEVINTAYYRDFTTGRYHNLEQYYFHALAKGWHIGAVGDQDNHASFYGNRKSSEGDIYLTGVLAESLTKPKILEALRQHRTYAFMTSPDDDRLYLDAFTADGHWMGEEFDDTDQEVNFRLAARSAANAAFLHAQIYRNGTLIAWREINSPSFDWTFVDSTGTGRRYYFAKIVQTDRDILWTSPIWVNGPGANLPTEAPLVKIADLRGNYTNGFPQHLARGNVRIRGVVTAGSHFGNQGPGYLQDSTAGISVFGPEFAGFVAKNIGPQRAFEVEVHGVVDFFNGLTQMLVYSVKRTNLVSPPAPVVLKTAEIAANGEKYEGKLVRVIGAQIISGSFPPANGSANLTIDDGSGPCTLRIDDNTDLAGQPTPSGRIEITGVLGQFDAVPPYTEGYQLLPRRKEDVVPATGVSAGDVHKTPQQFQLFQNHPNPFFVAGQTEIGFALPTASTVRAEIFNLLGERVALLVEEKFSAGEHRVRWSGRTDSGKAVAGGIYFYRVQVDSDSRKWSAVRKMVVLP